MAARKQWSELSPRTRRLLSVAAVVEGILKLAVLIDLKRRPASQIRGPKWLWATAVTVISSAGVVPVSYEPGEGTRLSRPMASFRSRGQIHSRYSGAKPNSPRGRACCGSACPHSTAPATTGPRPAQRLVVTSLRVTWNSFSAGPVSFGPHSARAGSALRWPSSVPARSRSWTAG
jgi:hypothetical protein